MSTPAFKAPPKLSEILKQRKPIRNINKEHADSLTPMNKLACFITDHVGTMGFFFLIFIWTVVWLFWNAVGPVKMRFDPFPAFVLWLFISNMVQIFLMPLIMVGQNVQAAHADLRAENDFEINVKAEREVEAILNHLEYQNAILITMLEKLGISREEAVKEMNHKADSPTPA
jgi:uncharacterized membrane protein